MNPTKELGDGGSLSWERNGFFPPTGERSLGAHFHSIQAQRG